MKPLNLSNFLIMARFSDQRMPHDVQDKVWDEFCELIAKLKTHDEARRFFKDLLNRQERLMLVRRLQIAKLLTLKATYSQIVDILQTGKPTIARVQRWLQFGRRGLSDSIKRIRTPSFRALEQRYRDYYRYYKKTN